MTSWSIALRRGRWLAATLMVIVAVVVLAIGVPTRRVFLYRSPPAIEARLLAESPLGSSAKVVLEYLRSIGVESDGPFRASIPAGSDYPPTTVGGEAFIHETVGRYRILFVVSVEAFYIFDSNGRLVDVRVRKTIDTL